MQVQLVDGKPVLMGEQPVELKPLELRPRCVKPQHELRRHERNAFSLGLPMFERVAPHAGEIVLVGSGPSVEKKLFSIRELKAKGHPVMAIKGSHDWLINHGIIPDFALAVDPLPRIADLYRKPKGSVVYFIASQCHPDVFTALVGCRVVLWNVYTKSAFDYWTKYIKRKKRKDTLAFVGGGSTSGLRAMALSYMLGFRKLHLFGYDSCLSEGNLLKITGERSEKVVVSEVEGRAFLCDMAMSQQAKEFEQQLRQMMPGAKVKCYGDGLIPWIAQCLHKTGCEQVDV